MTNDHLADAYPSADTLWRGAIVGGIVAGVTTARTPDYASTRQWIRNHYIMNGGDGRECLITFAGGHWYQNAPLIGCFFDAHSDRSPFTSECKWLAQAWKSVPPLHQDLANQAAMSYLRLEESGQVFDRITALVWDSERRLTSNDDWSAVTTHGGSLIAEEVVGTPEDSLDALRIDYGMSDAEMSLATSLCMRKLSHPAPRLRLTAAEADVLRNLSKDTSSFELSCTLLREIGIAVID